MNELSHHLRELLSKAGISENELARRTGVAQQVINRMLSGENINPKIASLRPLAGYFGVSISQLSGDANSKRPWQSIPLLSWQRLSCAPLQRLLLEADENIAVDVASAQALFALSMPDNSMEPKFSEHSLMIFNAEKSPSHGDFVLVHRPKDEYCIRQYFLLKNQAYQKSLNPNHAEYTPLVMSDQAVVLGCLIQSRTNYPD